MQWWVVRSALNRHEACRVEGRHDTYGTGVVLIDVSESSQRLAGEYFGFLEAVTNGDAKGSAAEVPQFRGAGDTDLAVASAFSQ